LRTPASIAPSRPRSDWSSGFAGSGSPWSATDISDATSRERPGIFPGSLTALPTPFENDDIAEKAFVDLIAWQIEQGGEGLVVGGVIGEAPTLSPAEKRRLIELAVETASRRVPIVAATGTNCTRETVALARAAEAAGATAVLIATPYYNKPNQEGLYRHFREIANAVGIPLILENDPSRTCVDIHPETLGRLAAIPNIVGVEDVACDVSRFSVHSLSFAPDFIRWSGDDSSSLLFRMAGGTCSVSIVANVVPRLWADMQRACEAGNWSKAKSIQTRLKPLVAALQLEPGPAPVKYALSLAHPWFGPTMRLPLVAVNQRTACVIASALEELKVVD
jgi:4-hydroxy-tetrahydrodipicolinate synthase